MTLKKTLFQILFILFFSAQQSSAQKISVGDRLTMQLYQENILIIQNLMGESSIGMLDKVKIRVDTIMTYIHGITFFRFTINDKCIQVVDDSLKVLFSTSKCKDFIVAFNPNNQIMYRLKGFSGNDLLFFLKDIKGQLLSKKNIENTLDNLDSLYIGIEFKRLYKSIKEEAFDDKSLIQCW
jgi:hypothetical protein